MAVPAFLNENPEDAAVVNPCYFDINEDGIVGTEDLLNVLTAYGLSCP